MTRRAFPTLSGAMIAGLGLVALVTAPLGCNPPSEGRPAGSIHIETARTSQSDVDAAKAKAKPSRPRRP